MVRINSNLKLRIICKRALLILMPKTQIKTMPDHRITIKIVERETSKRKTRCTIHLIKMDIKELSMKLMTQQLLINKSLVLSNLKIRTSTVLPKILWKLISRLKLVSKTISIHIILD